MNLNIETERLYIRALLITDVDFMYQLLNSNGWIQYIGDRNIHDIKAASHYIQNILNNDKIYYNVFEIKDTKIPIGIVTMLHRENQNYPDIGFAMLPQYEKRGYAFEAASKYLEELKNNQIGKIIAITKTDNQKSIALLIKLGMIFEKTYTDNNEVLNLYASKI
jgi:RimJ/RimL family protein N-acetyltransferase